MKIKFTKNLKINRQKESTQLLINLATTVQKVREIQAQSHKTGAFSKNFMMKKMVKIIFQMSSNNIMKNKIILLMEIKLISLWKISIQCKMKISKLLNCSKKSTISQIKTNMQIYNRIVVLLIMDIKI